MDYILTSDENKNDNTAELLARLNASIRVLSIIQIMKAGVDMKYAIDQYKKIYVALNDEEMI